jgi:hypothetical protein
MNSPLNDAARSGLYRTADAPGVAVASTAYGLRLAHVRLRPGGGKAELLDALAGALEFPRWFGRNWDALEDCLADLSWLSAQGHLILVEGGERLPREDLEVLCGILQTAAAVWAEQGTPWFAVLGGGPESLPDIGSIVPPCV